MALVNVTEEDAFSGLPEDGGVRPRFRAISHL